MSDRAFVYLAEVTGYNPDVGAEEVLRFSSGVGFTSSPSDTPAHIEYLARIEQAVDITRSIFAPGTTQGQSKTGFGDLVVLNPDGELDYLLPYAFDGRPIRILRGFIDDTDLSDFVPVFVGTQQHPDFSVDRISFKLRDNQAPLSLPIQPTKYAGTNVAPDGLEGVAGDLAGKPKVITYGTVFNVTPAAVNTPKLIYQVNDSAIASLDAVYDRGVALTSDGTYATEADLLNDTLAPAAGTYKVYLAGGLFRLGSSPARVTCDVTQGAAESDRTAAQLFRAILLRAGFDDTDIVADDLTTLDAKNSAVLGLYIDTETKVSDVLDQIAGTVGAWWGANADGKYRIVRLERPITGAVATFTANDLDGPPVRIPTADPERGLPAFRVTVRYAQNYTVQNSDVAGVVDDARRNVIAKQWREATVTDAAIRAVHLLAIELGVDSLFAFEDDAEDEATRLLALRGVQRHRFEIVAEFNEVTSVIDIGDTVGLSHDRYGLQIEGDDVGQLFIVLDVKPDAKKERLRLALWGNSFSTHNLVTDDGAFLATDDGALLITGAY